MLARAALGHVVGGGLVGIGLVVTGMFGGETTDIQLLEQALAALPEGDSPLRAQVLARLAARCIPGPTRQTTRRPCASRPSGWRGAWTTRRRCWWRCTRGTGPCWRPTSWRALANAAELLDVAATVGDQEMTFLAHHIYLHCLLELDIAAVDAELEAMAHLADLIRQPFYRWRTANMRAMRAMLDGRLEEAERLARGALEIGGLRQSEYVAYLFEHVLLVAIRWMQGRLGELQEDLGPRGAVLVACPVA